VQVISRKVADPSAESTVGFEVLSQALQESPIVFDDNALPLLLELTLATPAHLIAAPSNLWTADEDEVEGENSASSTPSVGGPGSDEVVADDALFGAFMQKMAHPSLLYVKPSAITLISDLTVTRMFQLEAVIDDLLTF